MSNSLFLWTGISRKSEVILKDQNLQIKKNIIQDNMLEIIKSSIDKLNKCDTIISINRCESNGNSRIKISINKFVNYEQYKR